MQERICQREGCSTPLGSNKLQKYCCQGCCDIARGAKRAEPWPERVCPACGAMFQPENAWQRYCPPTAEQRAQVKGQPRSRCARRASNHAHRTRAGAVTIPLHTPVVREFDCAQCGKACVKGENVAHHASKFCGYDCKSAWHYSHVEAPRLRRESAARKLERAARGAGSGKVIYGCQCAECGQSFLARIARATAYCSRVCARKAHARRRRAAGRERIGLHEIAERDGWRCGICRKAVKQGRVVPHPQAPTLDHIVPIALGGQHERENLQLAHFICNSRKSHIGVGDQLRLAA